MKKLHPKKNQISYGKPLPDILYRYRPANKIKSKDTGIIDCEGYDRLVKMIENDDFTIRLSHPYEFNDPYDTFISTSFEDLISPFDDNASYREIIGDILTRMFYFLYTNHDKIGLSSSDGKNINYDELLHTAAVNAFYHKINILDMKAFNDIKMIVEKGECEYFYSSRLKFSSALQNDLGIACFSEKVDNILMWSHYSENHTGYCLSYSKEALNEVVNDYKKNHVNTEIAAVKYQQNFDDKTKTLLKIEEEKIDILLKPLYESIAKNSGNINSFKDFQKHLESISTHIPEFFSSITQDPKFIKLIHNLTRLKSHLWEYEKEWRLITNLPENSTDEQRLIHIRPTCIYLGTKAPDTEIKRIKEAIEKSKISIQLRQMKMKRDKFELYVD